jgi:8-amino-7-oxononanoate synthase
VRYFLANCPTHLKGAFIPSTTPIQAVICPGNTEVMQLASHLQENNFAILPIRYPTVPQGEERLRICLHSFNTNEEIDKLLKVLVASIK